MILSSPALVLLLMIIGLWLSSLQTQLRVAILRLLRTVTQELLQLELTVLSLRVCWFFYFLSSCSEFLFLNNDLRFLSSCFESHYEFLSLSLFCKNNVFG